MNKKIVIVVLSFIILNLFIGYKFYKKNKYCEDFVRLHVVANSNSIDDQIIKLKINEKITNYINTLNLPKTSTNGEILTKLNQNYSQILEIVNSTLLEENYNYNSTLKIGKINYTERESINYDMPSGNYNSIQIILGKGEGENIWSLIFPNEENINNLKNFETIMPGISNIYKKNTTISSNYEIKILNTINKFIFQI